MNLAHNEILTEDDLAEGYILACQAEPMSDQITIEYWARHRPTPGLVRKAPTQQEIRVTPVLRLRRWTHCDEFRCRNRLTRRYRDFQP